MLKDRLVPRMEILMQKKALIGEMELESVIKKQKIVVDIKSPKMFERANTLTL